MKLVCYFKRPKEYPHRNTRESIENMCKSVGIEYEETSSIERLRESNYSILVSMAEFIDPEKENLPRHIKIVFGPHFWVFPRGEMVHEKKSENYHCAFNCLSTWVKDCYYEFSHSFYAPLVPFPFSIPVEKFRPRNEEKSKVILYIKRRNYNIVNKVRNLMKLLIRNDEMIEIEYGHYREEFFIESLHRSKFMVVLDAHESQGHALEEAMSMNVPLLVVDCKSMYDEFTDLHTCTYDYLKKDGKKLIATTVPYWSEKQCGLKLDEDEIDEKFVTCLFHMIEHYKEFEPRQFVLENLSDRVCMQRILDYFF